MGKRYARSTLERTSCLQFGEDVSTFTAELCIMIKGLIICLSSFVFDNYTWNRDGGDYTRYNGKLIPSRIPLSAFLSGESSAFFSFYLPDC